MKKWMFFGALLCLGGCATQSCDSATPGSPCRADHLLLQNDLLQAKSLIGERRQEGYELAGALLQRAAREDETGEAAFYEAVLLIRQNGDSSQINQLLQDSARHKYPLAIALLAQQAAMTNQQKARDYRVAYDELDVAKSGYPSFSQALVVVNKLVSANN